MLRAGRALAWTAAISVFVGAAWYGLAEEHITVDDPPAYDPEFSPVVNLQLYYDWFESTLVQERFYTAIAILGFACLVGVGLALRERFSRNEPRASVGMLGMTIGALLWILGNVLQLGAHRAIGKMAESGNALEPVNSIAFTFDTVDDWFELFAFAFLGIGVLSFTWEARRNSVRMSWMFLSLVLGVVLVALAIAYRSENGDLVDALLFLGGLVLLPAWLVWTAEAMLRPATSQVD
jgi:peptidoglycan/LPS O-acetylase OafA/YrhL